jgi:LacI family transcriptional regulator
MSTVAHPGPASGRDRVAGGGALVTSHDVARRAGVSQPTVSRALRDQKGVSMATRIRVREAARQLGYVPSHVGRSLATRTTGRVGVVSAELRNPFYPALIEPLHDALAELGFRMILATDRGDAEVELEPLIDGSLDGVVLTTVEIGSTLPAELSRRGLPYVLLNRSLPGVDADMCVADNDAGGAAVADFLVDLGHTRIGAIFGPSVTSTGRERATGFCRRLAERGRPLAAQYRREGPFRQDAARTALRELMREQPPPTALFCGNDVVALGVCNEAHAAGIAIPGELSVIGYDDIPMAAWEVFSLTTMRVDLAVMAGRAAALLSERIKNPGSPVRRVVLPPALVRRRTHGPPGG